MALYGWRIIGVAGTVLFYVAGIIYLSVSNIPGPHHPKRIRLGRFGELPNVQAHELFAINRKTQILWCRELKFLDGTPNLPPETHRELVVRKSFFKHRKRKALPSSNVPKNVSTSYVEKPKQKKPVVNSSATEHEGGWTALASFPGSGNTWFRYLLQQSTGILTGSIYKDFGLLKSGFPAENICNKSVLVVKTHEWGPKALKSFSKAILLVRDPDKAILAEFNRQSGGHVGFASPDLYKRTKGRYWQQFVRNKLFAWEEMNLDWAKNFTGSLKVVFYDDLVTNVEETLRDVLNFIDFPVEESLLNCALIRKEGIFRRKKRLLSFDPFSPLMHKKIDEVKEKVYNILGRIS